jgi:hypothetical protein
VPADFNSPFFSDMSNNSITLLDEGFLSLSELQIL